MESCKLFLSICQTLFCMRESQGCWIIRQLFFSTVTSSNYQFYTLNHVGFQRVAVVV